MGVNRDRKYKVMDRDAFYDKYARLNYGAEDRYEFMADLNSAIINAGGRVPLGPVVERGPEPKSTPSTAGVDDRKRKGVKVVAGTRTTGG